MKNFITRLIQVAVVPALLLGYYLTGHTAFLFFVGVVYAIALASIAIVLAALFITSRSSANDIKAMAVFTRAAYKMKNSSNFDYINGIILWILTTVCSIYWESYILLALVITVVILSSLARSVFLTIYSKMERAAAEDFNMTVLQFVEETEKLAKDAK